MKLQFTHRFCCSFSLFVFLIAGCSDPAAKMKIDQEYPQWDEFVTLTSTEVLMPIDTAFAQEDWKGFNKALNNPEFKAALDAFEKSELPSHFATDERAKAKADAVADYRECIKLAGSNGNTKQIKEAYESARQNLNKVAAPIKN
ncbi:hypothetical protein [Gimesia maris]|uniref:hypothetical protein n=1 Tax=Gimesia maris TaxID=122 RepID=UPI00241F25F9|nr:hypothetical protein [Gimesia maris]|tara:strand:- start:15648 stop:16079 length:432 start_codon:yes stop_codon:yes gene_type:complete